MINKLSEQEINQFQQGDKHAFERVFKMYYAPLVFFTSKIIGNRDESEDIVTDVLASLYNRRNSFDSEDNIRAYLYVSARNRCYNYLRAQTRHGINALDYADDVKDDNMLAYEYLVRAEIMEALHAAIEELPDVCGKIFKMIYYDNLSTQEVAMELKITTSTVYVQKMRAISMLRKKLAGYLFIIIWLVCLIKQVFDSLFKKIF